MISRIRGTLLRRELDVVELFTQGGVAYEISIPTGVFEKLPREGGEVELRTVQVVREDSVELFGFTEQHERALFLRLLTASGVGPRLALAMLSTLSPARLVRAIRDRDLAALKQVSGLGTKKAERLVVELGDKLDDLALAEPRAARPESAGAEEAVSALVALGYSGSDASEAVRLALDDDPQRKGPALIKAALARFNK